VQFSYNADGTTRLLHHKNTRYYKEHFFLDPYTRVQAETWLGLKAENSKRQPNRRVLSQKLIRVIILKYEVPISAKVPKH
jgi:hypothetical protein